MIPGETCFPPPFFFSRNIKTFSKGEVAVTISHSPENLPDYLEGRDVNEVKHLFVSGLVSATFKKPQTKMYDSQSLSIGYSIFQLLFYFMHLHEIHKGR